MTPSRLSRLVIAVAALQLLLLACSRPGVTPPGAPAPTVVLVSLDVFGRILGVRVPENDGDPAVLDELLR